jgi:hypothetical protein
MAMNIDLVRSDLREEGTRKWGFGVLASNGRIYCLPMGAHHVLCIDPSPTTAEGKPTTSLVGDNYGNNDFKWGSGIVALNGMIYGIPCHATQVLQINPFTGSTALISDDFGPSESKWGIGILAKDEKIYAIPCNARQVPQIDLSTDTTRLIGRDLGDL